MGELGKYIKQNILNSWKAVAILTICISCLLGIIWLFYAESREGVVKMIAALPIYMSILFIFFATVTTIVVIVVELRRWRTRTQSISKTNNLSEGEATMGKKEGTTTVLCLVCNEPITFPQYVIDSTKYSGQIRCQACTSILHIKKAGSDIGEYRIVHEKLGKILEVYRDLLAAALKKDGET